MKTIQLIETRTVSSGYKEARYTMVYVSEEILDFLTGIHVKRNDANRQQAIFDEAFRKAYGDMWTHTGDYLSIDEYLKSENGKENIISGYNKTAIKEAVKNHIKSDFVNVENLTAQTFSEWHKAICKKIVDIGNCNVTLIKNTKDNIDKTRRNRRENKSLKDIEGEYDYIRAIIAKGELHFECSEKTVGDCVVHAKKAEMEAKGIIISTPFSYGQAQKLVNMMLKYLYMYCNCDGITALNPCAAYFHAPLDRYVLKAAIGTEDYLGTPWSQINSYELYTEIQNAVNNGKSQRYPSYINRSAFEWELAEWPF